MARTPEEREQSRRERQSKYDDMMSKKTDADTEVISEPEEKVVEPTIQQPTQPIVEKTPVTPPSGSSDYSPFGENPTERDYTKPTSGAPNAVIPDIPEPKNTTAPVTPDTKSEPSKITNPDLANASSFEKRASAEMFVDMSFSVYDKLHVVGRYFTKISEGKIMEMATQDKINLQMQVPTNEDGTSSVSVGEFFVTFNKQIDEAISLDTSFKNKVREPMIRIFEKKGWGLTDEQFVMFAFGQDIVEKASICYSLNATMNNMISMFTKAHAKEKEPQVSTPSPKKDSEVHEAEEITEPEEAQEVH